MPLILSKTDFNESYYNGGGTIGGYDFYSATTYYNETAEQLAQKFLEKSRLLGTDLIGRKVLVCGSAYGFLVKYLRQLSVSAFGIDWSSYAISQAPSEITPYVLLGDVTLSADWTRIRTLAGLTKQNDKFDLVIDEDMICCLTDSQAVTFRTLAMNNSNMFIHFMDASENLALWYNWKTISQWKTLLGTSPKEKWYTRFNWEEN